ncbi:hypothetical protein K5688_001511 [Campylobacter lari]|nr:hypothetical protein [Campylobacter lari]
MEAKSLNLTAQKTIKIKTAYLPDKLYIGDYSNARYTGYYSLDGKTAYITGKTSENEGGYELQYYLYFFGFKESIIGQKVIVEVDRDGLGFRSKEIEIKKQQTIGNWNGFYNLDGTFLGKEPVGIFITKDSIPIGTYNITFKYNNIVSKYVLIKQI